MPIMARRFGSHGAVLYVRGHKSQTTTLESDIIELIPYLSIATTHLPDTTPPHPTPFYSFFDQVVPILLINMG